MTTQRREKRLQIFVDTDPEIGLYGKLKITICTPISDLPEIGFFMRKSRRRDLRAGGCAGLFRARRARFPSFPVIRLLLYPCVPRPMDPGAVRDKGRCTDEIIRSIRVIRAFKGEARRSERGPALPSRCAAACRFPAVCRHPRFHRSRWLRIALGLAGDNIAYVLAVPMIRQSTRTDRTRRPP